DPNRMPRHVACVMDGNGRWATKQGLPRTEGHRAGEEALFDTACGALDLGISYFTVYAFSTENWRRPHEEVRFLLNVIAEQLLTRRRDELHRMGVRIRFIGRRDWRGGPGGGGPPEGGAGAPQAHPTASRDPGGVLTGGAGD